MILDLYSYTIEQLYAMLDARKALYEKYTADIPSIENDYRIWQIMCHAQEQDIRKIEATIKHKEQKD